MRGLGQHSWRRWCGRSDNTPLVEENDEPGGEIAGHATRKHSVRVRFSVMQTFRQSKLRLGIDATIVIWSAPDLARVMTPSLHTNFAEVDSALAALAKVSGLPLREKTSFTRTYEAGKPFNTTQEWTTTTVLAKTIAESAFQVPKGYVHQFPQYTAPSRLTPATHAATSSVPPHFNRTNLTRNDP